MKIIFRISLLLLIQSASLFAYEPFPEKKKDPFEGKTEFNDLTLHQFGHFTDWKLVTVRYRKDSGELRFIYANESAWKGLSDGVKTYEDGSVFAKIAIKTEEDPTFPSSAVP